MLLPEERAALAAYTPTPETIAKANAALVGWQPTPNPKGPAYLLVQPRTCQQVIEAEARGEKLPRVGDVAEPRDPLTTPMGGDRDGTCMHGIPTKRVTRQNEPDAGWVVEFVGKCDRCPGGVISYFKPGPPQ